MHLIGKVVEIFLIVWMLIIVISNIRCVCVPVGAWTKASYNTSLVAPVTVA
jgi:hypothetical protein